MGWVGPYKFSSRKQYFSWDLTENTSQFLGGFPLIPPSKKKKEEKVEENKTQHFKIKTQRLNVNRGLTLLKTYKVLIISYSKSLSPSLHPPP